MSSKLPGESEESPASESRDACAPSGESAAGDPAAGESKPPPSKKSAKASEDPDDPLLYAEKPVPSADELRSALAWAFEKEDIEDELLDRFAEHAGMVMAGNQVMNLTAIVDAREVAAKHYLDSWRATRLLPLMGRQLMDLGTGAGFPGVPIALAETQAKICLIDSTQKRADFVGRCVEKLSISNAFVEGGRAEEHLARNHYDIVFARALSSVRENVRLLRKVRHSLKDLVMLKGPSWSREVRAGEREAERLGFRLDTVWEHELPEGMGKRAILVYRAPGGAGM